MSTNHPERLDPALVRPGRVDLRIKFGLCTKAQVAVYARHFYGNRAASIDVQAIVDKVPENLISVADLQGAHCSLTRRVRPIQHAKVCLPLALMH